jgi:hypothetical protein
VRYHSGSPVNTADQGPVPSSRGHLARVSRGAAVADRSPAVASVGRPEVSTPAWGQRR